MQDLALAEGTQTFYNTGVILPSQTEEVAMSARRKRWVLREPPPITFGQQAGLDPLIATLLYHRNIREEAAIQNFLEADYRSGLHDPMLLKGMPEASERIA